MAGNLKSRIKRSISSSGVLALLTASCYYRLLSIPAWVYRQLHFRGRYLPASVKLIGMRRMHIGLNTVIGAGSWLNVNDRGGTGTALQIGENCFIGQDNFFTVGKSIVIGDYCLTTKGCAFIGSGHVYSDPMMPYQATGTETRHEIYVGANCFFGVDAKVMGNVRIGHGSIIGAGAVVRTDIPPYSLVVGDPGVVLKRYDFGSRQWRRWPIENYVDGPAEPEYVQALRSKYGYMLHPVPAAGRFSDLL